LRIVGVDFTSAPTREKPIVVAECTAGSASLQVERFLEFCDWPAYEQWLAEDGEWIGGFDFPFGLPRRFVRAQGWPLDWPGMVNACVRGGKERFVEGAMRAFQRARSLADKHRRTDLAAGSESPLKTKANPPVGRMFYEGAWRLLAAGVRVPGSHETRSAKVALEVYPGLLVSRLGVGYYKNDKPASAARNAEARTRILEHLRRQSHASLPCRVRLRGRAMASKLEHASGDWLDAIACAVHAHWGWQHRAARFGLPAGIDPVEGWVLSA
jgi:hypothetical protein